MTKRTEHKAEIGEDYSIITTLEIEAIWRFVVGLSPDQDTTPKRLDLLTLTLAFACIKHEIPVDNLVSQVNRMYQFAKQHEKTSHTFDKVRLN